MVTKNGALPTKQEIFEWLDEELFQHGLNNPNLDADTKGSITYTRNFMRVHVLNPNSTTKSMRDAFWSSISSEKGKRVFRSLNSKGADSFEALADRFAAFTGFLPNGNPYVAPRSKKAKP